MLFAIISYLIAAVFLLGAASLFIYSIVMAFKSIFPGNKFTNTHTTTRFIITINHKDIQPE